MHQISQDIRFGVRLLARDRGFAITAILILGVGIGINNMLFTILRAHTLRGLPIDRPERVLFISSFDQRTAERGLSFAEFLDLRAETTSFSTLAAFVPAAVALGDQGRSPDRVDAAYSTANAFAVLGARPAAGRIFGAHEDRDGAARVVVLGYRVWTTRYNADPSILGQTVLIDGRPSTVVGVMPPRSGFPSTAELWLPLSSLPDLATQTRAARQLRIFGRLHDSVTTTDARAEVESIIARLAREFPETSRDNHARVTPINQRVLGRLTDPAWLAFMGFGFLALILSSANVANLMLARAIDRTREVAVRVSLGATRLRVIRQLLIESSVVAALGGLLGLAVSFVGVRAFESAIPPNTLPYWLEYHVDTPVLIALVAVAIVTVLVFGVIPAWHASKADANGVLRSGGRGLVQTPGARGWTSVFMVLELGITVVMLTYLVVDVQSSQEPLASERILDTGNVLTGTVTLPPASYATAESRRAFFNRLQVQTRALPGISSVSIASLLPRRGAFEQTVEVEGRTVPVGEQAAKTATVAIGPHFFQTLALPMERGREFTEWDARLDAAGVIVSSRFAELLLPDRDPIGSRIRLTPANSTATASRWFTIIGVAQQVQHRQERESVVYLPFDASPPSTASVLLRTEGDASAATTGLREALRKLDPDLPVYRVLTMSQVITEATWNGRVASRVVRVITTIAFLFCVVGLYAVTARAVAQRTSEIGVRMALGARPPHVALLILKSTVVQVVVGLLAGIAGTFAWESAFGRPNAPLAAAPNVLVPITLLLAAATLAACWVPANRAIRVDPAEALRNE